MDSTALALTLAGFGLLLFVLSYQRHRHHRDGSAVLHGAAGIVLFAGGALLFEVALNLHTYQDMQDDTPVAEISFTRQGKNLQASLMRIPSGELQAFTLTGATWYMQARLLHWQRLAPWLGLTHQMRLEQLVSNDARHPDGRGSRYALSHDAGINLWQWGLGQDPIHAWLRSELVESAPLSLDEGQRFHIYLHAGQLQTRQINRPGKEEPTTAPTTPVLNDTAVTLLKNSDLSIDGSSPPSGQSNHSSLSSSSAKSSASHP